MEWLGCTNRFRLVVRAGIGQRLASKTPQKTRRPKSRIIPNGFSADLVAHAHSPQGFELYVCVNEQFWCLFIYHPKIYDKSWRPAITSIPRDSLANGGGSECPGSHPNTIIFNLLMTYNGTLNPDWRKPFATIGHSFSHSWTTTPASSDWLV